MRQQDIVWVQVPFSDMERQKKRPALIVSHEEYNSSHEDILICTITTNPQKSAYKIGIGQENLSAGKLPLPSMVRVDKILPVEKELVETKMARINDKTYDQITRKVHSLIERQTT